MVKIFWIAVAGSFGTLARYGLAGLVQRSSLGLFPWGTWVVNLLGCFLFGLIWPLAEERLVISSDLRMIILIGFMGAFTTFSTYIFETSQLVRTSQWVFAIANVFSQTLLGILFLTLGLALSKSL